MPELPREGGVAHRLDSGAGRAGRPRGGQSRRPGRREGDLARDHRRQGSHPQGPQAPHPPARDPQDEGAHQLADQRGDGQKPAGVRPPTAAQGHQGGARRRRGRSGRSRRYSNVERIKRRRTCPTEAEQVAKKQLKRLPQHAEIGSAEYTVVRTYLDWILDLPWHTQTPDNMDIGAVRKVLDEDHYGLEKVKKRILEYLAVRKLKKDKKGPIRCASSGPPRRRQAVARPEHRPLARLKPEVRPHLARRRSRRGGHPRAPAVTYVGALPGNRSSRDDEELLASTTSTPVFMMDKVDKIGHDFRARFTGAGAPRSARSRAEQHVRRTTTVWRSPYDLSKVMFVATANIADPIPAPLWR